MLLSKLWDLSWFIKKKFLKLLLFFTYHILAIRFDKGIEKLLVHLIDDAATSFAFDTKKSFGVLVLKFQSAEQMTWAESKDLDYKKKLLKHFDPWFFWHKPFLHAWQGRLQSHFILDWSFVLRSKWVVGGWRIRLLSFWEYCSTFFWAWSRDTQKCGRTEVTLRLSFIPMLSKISNYRRKCTIRKSLCSWSWVFNFLSWHNHEWTQDFFNLALFTDTVPVWSEYHDLVYCQVSWLFKESWEWVGCERWGVWECYEIRWRSMVRGIVEQTCVRVGFWFNNLWRRCVWFCRYRRNGWIFSFVLMFNNFNIM